jgi:hypothetical protein
MSDTTSILDLPTDPAGGNIGTNISMMASEKMNANQSGGGASALTLDQTTINQIVSGLQQASATGATQLPSRDIPQVTTSITQDPQIQPNYIPPTQNNDYIKEYEQNQDIINNYNRSSSRGDSLDEIYDELQTPILLAVLFFLFQLPIFRKYLFTYIPILFSKDGNLNLQGYLFMSVLFGVLYYILGKIMVNFNRF